jgi:hypothetical protein
VSMVAAGQTLNTDLQPVDRTTEQLREQIRRELKNNRKVKGLLREGRQPQGVEWVRSKQAQCAILGHVPPKNGTKCYFCGAEL